MDKRKNMKANLIEITVFLAVIILNLLFYKDILRFFRKIYDNTDIHFEDVHEWVAKIEAKKTYFSEEERLVNLAFPSKEY